MMAAPRADAARDGVGPSDGATLVRVRVSPGAKASRVKGFNRWRNEWELSVQAPPEKGEANREVTALIATVLGVGEGDVSISSGQRDRSKVVLVRGVGPDDAIRMLREAAR